MAVYELDGTRPEFPADGLYWVAETASVIGRVRLHSDVSIWYGWVLRGDNEWIEIGARSQVQDNSTLNTDPAGCAIPCGWGPNGSPAVQILAVGDQTARICTTGPGRGCHPRARFDRSTRTG